MKQDIDEANTNFTESHKYARPTLNDRLGRGGGDAILVVNSIRFLSSSFPPSSFAICTYVMSERDKRSRV